MTALLEVADLTTVVRSRGRDVEVVRDVSFDVAEGETLAIVGESGSGKSMTMLSVMGLLPAGVAQVTSGSVRFDGVDLLAASDRTRRGLLGRQLAMVYQNPMTSLHPMQRIGDQLVEALTVHGEEGRTARERALEVLGEVGMPRPDRALRSFPHQLSGGMRQRAVIAMALMGSPKLLVADEPTTALDVTVQAQVLEALEAARTQTGAALVMITHDLGVIAGHVDHVNVMYAGRIVESGTVDEVFYTPRMPYTVGLLGSLPRLDGPRHARLTPIRGTPPSMLHLPPGCPFAPRCPMAEERCLQEEPPLEPAGESLRHVAACHFSHRLAETDATDLFGTTTTDTDIAGDQGGPEW